ncbi:hypothetical protein O6H91_16G007100 [Diphasiastrum complanatum]|uniref:Uncharacterized protein n=1 Tax=Diphasiastrum complanatum TaxID=34168 RepID=A0ACC2B9N6_DIPCM|nr:hypothetical protein O6H91_16G007100 [Diphasiastrum complanatum]
MDIQTLKKMDPKMAWQVVTMFMTMLFSSASVMASQPPDCTPQLEQMQGCLSFVEGQVQIPSTDCCNGLREVHLHSPVCLCELISSNGDHSSTPGINVTQALLLPNICKVSTDESRCTALLAGASPSAAPSPSSTPSGTATKGGGASTNSAGIAQPPICTFFLVMPVLQLLLKLAIQ